MEAENKHLEWLPGEAAVSRTSQRQKCVHLLYHFLPLLSLSLVYVHVHLCMCVHMHGGQKSPLSSFLYCSSP